MRSDDSREQATESAKEAAKRPAKGPAVTGYVRWKALLPLSVTLLVIVTLFVLFADSLLRRGVETSGTHIVGARVDLREADLDLSDGSISMRGLAVTNPGAPMTNLFEAEELQLDMRMLPLLESKIILDTVRVLGLRFNTPREESGAIEDASETSEGVRNIVADWKSQVHVPPLALSTLTQAVNVDAISADSLATLQAARHARAYVDTAKAKLAADLEALDPRPTLDSAQALVERLRNASLRTLGIGGVRDAARDLRRTIAALDSLDDRLRAFETEMQANAGGMTQRLAAIPAARERDYAYAQSLLNLPTLDVPSLGPQLFSDLIADRVGELLYWVQMAEEYLPPGIRRQLHPGPQRQRASGTDVLFAKPGARVLPDFLMQLAELSLAIGGEGAAAGDYEARIVGATTQPAVYGSPTTFMVSRSGGTGPTGIRVGGMLDHRTTPVRDSVQARVAGLALPSLPLAGLGAMVTLGDGSTELRLTREGDNIDGRWLWRAPGVTWSRDSSAVSTATGTMRLVEDAVWRAVSRLDSIEIEATFSGAVTKPSLGIRTNIANAVAGALREQLGDEVRRAEAQVRARVDELVSERVAEARSAGAGVKAEAEQRVAAERARLEEQRAALEAKLRELVRIPGIGGG
ncbi:MAG TPA: TIGR03545 family protein [Gemmatimonadaceae bacterium]|nr:TIGR03545 family protein [Gemmatimonadaceae bacterium]